MAAIIPEPILGSFVGAPLGAIDAMKDSKLKTKDEKKLFHKQY